MKKLIFALGFTCCAVIVYAALRLLAAASANLATVETAKAAQETAKAAQETAIAAQIASTGQALGTFFLGVIAAALVAALVGVIAFGVYLAWRRYAAPRMVLAQRPQALGASRAAPLALSPSNQQFTDAEIAGIRAAFAQQAVVNDDAEFFAEMWQ